VYEIFLFFFVIFFVIIFVIFDFICDFLIFQFLFLIFFEGYFVEYPSMDSLDFRTPNDLEILFLRIEKFGDNEIL